MDTEGFGAQDATQDSDARVFVLACLLCSVLVYNSMGAIQESAISNLSFIANMSRHIQMSSSQSGAPNDVADVFPAFLWILRDFTLTMRDEVQRRRMWMAAP